ncbi:MAG: ABC transporter substrate-binding protein [Rhodocyclaceae bacterium]
MVEHVFTRRLDGRRLAVAAVLAIAMAATAFEVRSSELVLGVSAEISNQGLAVDQLEGARLYFEEVNRAGGVGGKRLRLEVMDDGRDPAVTVANTRALIANPEVVALFGYRATPTIRAALPVVEEAGIALIAPFSGAEFLYGHPYVFPVRAGYRDEARRAVSLASTLAVTRFAILHQTDEFGQDGLAGYLEGLKDLALEPVAVASYDRAKLDTDEAVRSIAAARPHAVLMACTPAACFKAIRQLREADEQALVLMLSNVAGADFAGQLGSDCRGVGLTMVMPRPRSSMDVPIAGAFARSAQAARSVAVNEASFEGYVAARLVVEALRRVEGPIGREQLVAALNGLGRFDLGGIPVDFSSSSGRVDRYVDLAVMGSDCRLMR